MAITKTSIANFALGHIGDKQIASIDDTSNKSARTCLLHYDQARDEVLASHRWSSCKKQTRLSASVTDPIYKWTYRFALPSDFIRLTEVQGVDAYLPQKWYDIQSGYLLLDNTYSDTDAETVAIEYISRNDDPSTYDPLLVSAVSLMLAVKIAKSITGSDGKAGELREEYERIVAPKAMTMDAHQRNSNENNPAVKMMKQSRLVQSRRAGG